jgi:hypothetical protein
MMPAGGAKDCPLPYRCRHHLVGRRDRQACRADRPRHGAPTYNGKNIKGKKGGFGIYLGGIPAFAKACADAVENDYRGFVRQ